MHVQLYMCTYSSHTRQWSQCFLRMFHRVVANSPAEGRITVTIMNEMGREPALNLQVIVTMLPEFVTRVSTFDDVSCSGRCED